MPEIQIKNTAQKSEVWLSVITAIAAVFNVYLAHIEGIGVWIALGSCIALAAVYTFFKTSLASQSRPGWKTKPFWVAIGTVVASVAAAIAETPIPGLPPKIAQIAGVVTTVAMALGYNIWRYREKTGAR